MMGFSRLVAAVMVPLLLTACASRTPAAPEGTAAQPTQPRAPLEQKRPPKSK